MKPTKIMDVMDLAWAARQAGYRFAPCFRGPAGVGKSEIVQQWVKKQQKINPDFGFVDFRIAYMEAPDMRGVPKDVQINGVWRSITCIPDIWPTEGQGVILFEEFNRGTTAVMNCLMQLMTDRQVGHDYKLPDGWMVAACVNPDDPSYDLNSIDAALADRFEFFDIDYDHMSFLKYMEANSFDPSIIMFIKSGEWTYREPGSIATKEGGKYISPRTWSKMNAAEKAGAKAMGKQFHHIVCASILGKHIGNMYFKTCWDDAPVTAHDLITDTERALEKLKKQSDPSNYMGDRVAITVDSIIANYGGLPESKGGTCQPDQIDEDLMAQVAEIIPADQSVNLIKECGFKAHRSSINTFLKEFMERHPNCFNVLKANIRISKVVDQPKKK